MSDIPSPERFEPAPPKDAGSPSFAASDVADDQGAGSDASEFFSGWLSSVCKSLRDVRYGVLCVLQQEHRLARIASWPGPDAGGEALDEVFRRAERTGAVQVQESAADEGVSVALVAFPLVIVNTVHALAGFCLVQRAGGASVEHRLQALTILSVTLREYLQRGIIERLQTTIERSGFLNELVAGVVEAETFHNAALQLTTELARKLECERVSLGLCDEADVEVSATSDTANPELSGNIIRQIGDAMVEVVRAGQRIVIPASGNDEMLSGDHRVLAEAAKDVAICSVPLMTGAVFMGVITFERTRGTFDEREVEACTVLGKLLGPMLEQRLDAERGVFRHIADEVQSWGRRLLGPRYTGLKFFSSLALILVLFLTFVHVPYRVSARTVVEGAVQRAVVAPFEGYVAESLVRAGDTVTRGQLIVRLDERDLLVERAKWDAEHEQHLRKYRQAMAGYDRAAMSVIGAQVNQAEAQLKLVEDKLARARVIAPFDGVVVSGDLSQLVGTPVEQGKLLFEIAPLDAYRVILKVDERDITYVALGQAGELRLSGMPSTGLPFSVKQITSVSTADEGRNYFRVEAHMEAAERLRPGMEGVGKIVTQDSSLIWIWTHNLTDWLRLTLWSWLP